MRREKTRAHLLHSCEDVVIGEVATPCRKAHHGVRGLESPGGYGGRACRGTGFLARVRLNDLFNRIGGQIFALYPFQESNLLLGGERTKRVQMSAGDVAGLILPGDLLDGGIEVEDGEELGDFPLGLAGLPGEVVLGVVIRVPQAGQGVGKIERVHVEALPVLDDLVKQHVLLLGRLYPAGNFGETRFAGGVVASFPGDDLVDVLAFEESHGDGLEDAEPLHRIVEFLLGVGVEPAAGLVRVGPDALAGDGKGTSKSSSALDGAVERALRVSERRQRLLAERAAGRLERRLDRGAEFVVRLHRRGCGRRRLRGCVGHGG